MLNAFKRFSLAFFYFAEPLKWLVITETEEACMPEKILLKSMLSLFFQQKRSAGLILFVKGWNKWICRTFWLTFKTMYFKDISGLICQQPGLDPHFLSFNRKAYGYPSRNLEFLARIISIKTTCFAANVRRVPLLRMQSFDWGI